ncbi:hypothetical protein AB5I41_08710 [Sphingomonas sp. MMS24-JH45]
MAAVNLVITNLAVFACDRHGGGGLTLTELAPGVALDDVHAATAAPLPFPLIRQEPLR